jgi:hypothetical protein
MAEQSPENRIDWDRVFRWSAIVFAIAIVVHGADHLRRGMDVVPPAVMMAGMAQIVLAAATVSLVFLGSRWAAHAAVAIGFLSAVGFTAAHMLPAWGFFSDSFINAPPAARVTWFSWLTAVCEILADLLFAIVGITVLRARRGSRTATLRCSSFTHPRR